MQGAQTLHSINQIWRFYCMYKETQGFVKGLGIGVAASVAAVTIGAKMMKENKHIKRDANKAMHAMGDVLNNVEHMFK